MKCLMVLPGLLTAGQAGAQPYPAKFIRVINPAAPGGNSGLLFRTLTPKMESAAECLVEKT